MLEVNQQLNNASFSSIEQANNEEVKQNITNDVPTDNKAKEYVDARQAEQKSEQISTAQMEEVAQQLQDFVGRMNKGLEFHVHEDSGKDVIKVIDKNNGELIKQYPSEEVLNLVAKLSEAAGIFVNSKV